MEGQNEQNIIKEAIANLLEKMGFPAEVESSEKEENGSKTYLYNVKTSDSNFLIGQYGVNLQALQHIIRVVVRKRTSDRVNFVVDVNNYRQEKNESIEKMARDIADQVIQDKKEIVMRPMSAYERRIVHMELSKNNQIKTESIGEGESRKVVVKPV